MERLAEAADIVINTHLTSSADVLVRVAGHLGLYGRGVERLVDVLVGGQYGSEERVTFVHLLLANTTSSSGSGAPCWAPSLR